MTEPKIETIPDLAFEGPPYALRADLKKRVTFGLNNDCAEVLFSEHRDFDEVVRCARVSFLLRQQALIGVRVFELSTAEYDALVGFVSRLPGCGLPGAY